MSILSLFWNFSVVKLSSVSLDDIELAIYHFESLGVFLIKNRKPDGGGEFCRLGLPS